MVSPVANRIYDMPKARQLIPSRLVPYLGPLCRFEPESFPAVADTRTRESGNWVEETYGSGNALGQQRALSELQLVPVYIEISFACLRPGFLTSSKLTSGAFWRIFFRVEVVGGFERGAVTKVNEKRGGKEVFGRSGKGVALVDRHRIL